MSNFEFLNKKWTMLAKLGKQAESYYNTDNNATMLKCVCLGNK
ncbi:MAG: type I restriction enzyme R subunit [Clostridium sp.]|jgi:type I restriction enzyme R subunit